MCWWDVKPCSINTLQFLADAYLCVDCNVTVITVSVLLTSVLVKLLAIPGWFNRDSADMHVVACGAVLSYEYIYSPTRQKDRQRQIIYSGIKHIVNSNYTLT